MQKSKRRSRIFETKYFGPLIGLIIFGIILLLNESTTIFDNIEEKMLDVHFGYKSISEKSSLQEGVSQDVWDPKISSDILIVAIDFNSLSKFGKWPFPRYREGDFLNSLSRIQNENERERSIFLDIFFIEPDEKGYDDVLLIDAIDKNGRVFLETVLDEYPSASQEYDDFFERQEILFEEWGRITNISGGRPFRGSTAFSRPSSPMPGRAAVTDMQTSIPTPIKSIDVSSLSQSHHALSISTTSMNSVPIFL
jgi:adenylate cyclase